MFLRHEELPKVLTTSEEAVEYAQQFNYLRSIINEKVNLDTETNNILSTATRAF